MTNFKNDPIYVVLVNLLNKIELYENIQRMENYLGAVLLYEEETLL